MDRSTSGGLESIPQRSEGKKYAKEFWTRIDELFFRTIGYAEKAFRINIYINMIVVLIGCVILGYSIVYSWNNGLDVYSTAFGTIGVASFIATFYLTPQDRIQKTVGDLTQIQICYRTYCMAWESIADWQRDTQAKAQITLDQLERMNKHLVNLTMDMAKNIEEILSKEVTHETQSTATKA